MFFTGYLYVNANLWQNYRKISKFELKEEACYVCISRKNMNYSHLSQFYRQNSLNELPIFISLLHRYVFRTKYQISTRLTFQLGDNRDYMLDNYLVLPLFQSKLIS